jgi:hypothetical protein
MNGLSDLASEGFSYASKSAWGHSNETSNQVTNQDMFNYHSSQWRDVTWLVLFLIHLVLIITLGATYEPNFTPEDEKEGINEIPEGVWHAAAASLVTCIIAGYIWLQILRKFASAMIKLSFIAISLLFSVMTIVSLVGGSILGAIGFSCFNLVFLLYYFLIRHRIGVTAALLEASVEVVNKYDGTIFVSFMGEIFLVGWFVVWSFSIQKVAEGVQSNDDDTRAMSDLLFFLFLVSLYWTLNVIKYIVHVTIAGVAATWYYFSDPRSPTWYALKRATTTSLGSICLGSFIIAIISALRTLVESAKKNEHDFVRVIVLCILKCLESLMQFFNKYAYCYVAIYGTSYIESAKRAWNLFVAQGFDVLINDDLSEIPGVIAAFLGGVLGAGVGYIASGEEVLGFWIGLIIGASVLSFFMTVLSSCVATFYVLWAEDPAALQQSHPDSARRIGEAFIASRG